MAWITLIMAGFFEMLGVLSINKLQHDRNWQAVAILILAFSTSFCLLAHAMTTLPMGTSYAIWTGMGTVGSTVIGMVYYGESRDWRRVLFIAIILSATIGLKIIS